MSRSTATHHGVGQRQREGGKQSKVVAPLMMPQTPCISARPVNLMMTRIACGHSHLLRLLSVNPTYLSGNHLCPRYPKFVVQFSIWRPVAAVNDSQSNGKRQANPWCRNLVRTENRKDEAHVGLAQHSLPVQGNLHMDLHLRERVRRQAKVTNGNGEHNLSAGDQEATFHLVTAIDDKDPTLSMMTWKTGGFLPGHALHHRSGDECSSPPFGGGTVSPFGEKHTSSGQPEPMFNNRHSELCVCLEFNNLFSTYCK